MTHSDCDKPFIIPYTGHHEDNRGWLAEQKFPDGFSFTAKQTLETCGGYSVVKGLHLHYNMSKLVHVLNGMAFDIVVNCNRNSDDFLKVYEYRLYPSAGWLYVPQGYAHGMIYISQDKCLVQYLFSEHYNPDDCVVINPLQDILYNPHGDIYKFLKNNDQLVISDRDKKGMMIQEWLSQ